MSHSIQISIWTRNIHVMVVTTLATIIKRWTHATLFVLIACPTSPYDDSYGVTTCY